jgi:serine/threonine protein kinase
MIDDKEFYFEQVFKEYEKIEDFKVVPKKNALGKGSFGLVKLIMYNNKKCAGKIVSKDNFDEMEYIKDLVGPHIVKIEKICRKINKYGKDYYLIIMERAALQDLSKFNLYIHDKNLLRLINPKCFDEEFSDTLLRFFARQIIDGMMTLYLNNYVHFDIKPENILILNNLILKITDFDLLREVKDNEKEIKIPGGTHGYMTVEYHLDKRLDSEDARTQDYFALGCTLFSLKFGFSLLKYSKEGDGEMLADEVFKVLDKNINYIESRKTLDKDFISFITKLIRFNPSERLNFIEIYRNKWVNKNVDIINKIEEDYDMNDEKYIIDIQKQDFFKQKKEIFEFNNKDNTSNTKNKRYIRKCFRFKKHKKEKEPKN